MSGCVERGRLLVGFCLNSETEKYIWDQYLLIIEFCLVRETLER